MATGRGEAAAEGAAPNADLPAPAARPAEALAGLSPASFGLVMATGIVSLAAGMLGHAVIAGALFALNIGQYGLLWGLYLLRARCHPGRFFGDMADHARGPGYFTAVAGTGVLASQVLLLTGAVTAGALLAGLAALLWLGLTYGILGALTVRRDKPPLDRGINGAWLLAVVATQALAVCGALLAPQAAAPLRLVLNFLALSGWLWGGMLYVWLMALIFYRYTFLPLAPGDLSPPYWINMGAMAISTLAGALLIQNAAQAPWLEALLPFLKGITILYWATGTWWIPMLLVLGWWRHVRQHFPLRYDTLYWGLVFPLGMYTACTWQMDRALGLGFLAPLTRIGFWVAFAVWALTFAGMLHRLAGLLRPAPRRAPRA